MRELIDAIAEEYGLLVHIIERTQRIEFWLLDNQTSLALLRDHPDDNVIRGRLCGYSDHLIDSHHVIEAPAAAGRS